MRKFVTNWKWAAIVVAAMASTLSAYIIGYRAGCASVPYSEHDFTEHLRKTDERADKMIADRKIWEQHSKTLDDDLTKATEALIERFDEEVEKEVKLRPNKIAKDRR